MAKTVLITGANRGIGQEVARVLATQGWDVLVGARDKQKGDAAAARLRKETGGRLKGVVIDVSAPETITTAAQKLRDGAIKLDALVNNAGVYRDVDARQTLETNFFGPLRVIDALLPLLRDDASITNVTSDLGALANLSPAYRRTLAEPGLTRASLEAAVHAYLASGSTTDAGTDAYGVSKAALNALTRILATELAPRGIRVNATSPGWVRTDMGGRGAPRSVEQGGASVVHGVTVTETGRVFRDGQRIEP